MKFVIKSSEDIALTMPPRADANLCERQLKSRGICPRILRNHDPHNPSGLPALEYEDPESTFGLEGLLLASVG